MLTQVKSKVAVNPNSNLATSHIIDSELFGDGFSTNEMRNIFSDNARLQRWLDVEVALAKAQAELGIIPQAAAKKIAQSANVNKFSRQDLMAKLKQTKHSLVPLLDVWRDILSKDHAQYIHYGATTQDIQDTAQVIAIQQVISIVERELKISIRQLTVLANRYRALVMVGRTHAQHATPITFGLKIATWLDECMRNAERLEQCKSRLLTGQLFGAVGSMAALTEQRFELLEKFCQQLKLNIPTSCWHSARDRFVEFTSILAMISATLGKIANEIIQLSKNEIAELGEPFTPGQIGSSTMPHKNNPEDCERIVTLASLVKHNACLSFDTLMCEHERDYRTIRLEWVSLSESSLFTAGAFSLLKPILKNLQVKQDNIQTNVEAASQDMASEALSFHLSRKLNKQQAYELVYNTSLKAKLKKSTLLNELMRIPVVNKNFTQDELEAVANPNNNLGAAVAITDRMILKSVKHFFLESHVTMEDSTDGYTVVTYRDPFEGFEGWIVFDGFNYTLSAGGMRVQKGLTAEKLKAMARNMTRKMQLCGIAVNGAKSGIDYDSTSPNKSAAISRFLRAIKPLLQFRYSMGSDLNTTMDELNQLVQTHGLNSVKDVIAAKQAYSPSYFKQRFNVLSKTALGHWTLGKIRAGYVVAMSAIRLAHDISARPTDLSIAVQGFGVLARAAIISLLDEGYRIHCVSDVNKTVVATTKAGLPIAKWLEHPGNNLPELTSCEDYTVYERDAIHQQAVDILVLAAIENAITTNNMKQIQSKAIIPGANLAVSDEADTYLSKTGVKVLPSFVAGSGGSMSMQGLFTPNDHPNPKEVLAFMKQKTFDIISVLLSLSDSKRINLKQAADVYLQGKSIKVTAKPYSEE